MSVGWGVLVVAPLVGLGVVVLSRLLVVGLSERLADGLLQARSRCRRAPLRPPVVTRADPGASSAIPVAPDIDWDDLLVELAARLRVHLGHLCGLVPEHRVLVLSAGSVVAHVHLEDGVRDGMGEGRALDEHLPGFLADERVRRAVEYLLAEARDFVARYADPLWAPARLGARPRAAVAAGKLRAWYDLGDGSERTARPLLVLGVIPLTAVAGRGAARAGASRDLARGQSAI